MWCVFSCLFSVLKVCNGFESLRCFSVSSDNQFGFKRGLSSYHAIYTVKSVVNEYCGILSGGIFIPDPRPRPSSEAKLKCSKNRLLYCILNRWGCYTWKWRNIIILAAVILARYHGHRSATRQVWSRTGRTWDEAIRGHCVTAPIWCCCQS